MKTLLKLTDTQKLQIIKRNDKETELIDNIVDLLDQLSESLDAKDIEWALDKNINTVLELLGDKRDRNYFESLRLSKELIKHI